MCYRSLVEEYGVFNDNSLHCKLELDCWSRKLVVMLTRLRSHCNRFTVE